MERATIRIGVGAVLVAWAAVSSAGADVLEMLDGRLREGRYMGGTQNTIRFLADGELRVVPVDEVLALTFTGDGGGAGAGSAARAEPADASTGSGPERAATAATPAATGAGAPPPSRSGTGWPDARPATDAEIERAFAAAQATEAAAAEPAPEERAAAPARSGAPAAAPQRRPTPPATPARARAAPEATGSSAGDWVTVPAGAALAVVPDAGLAAAKGRPGERFSGSLAEEIVVAGVVVAARGSVVYGRVTELDDARGRKSRALGLELTHVRIGERLLPVVTEREDATAALGRGQGLDALVGERLEFRLARPLRVPPAS